jgi:hypothetical protein
VTATLGGLSSALIASAGGEHNVAFAGDLVVCAAALKGIEDPGAMGTSA